MKKRETPLIKICLINKDLFNYCSLMRKINKLKINKKQLSAILISNFCKNKY